MIGSMEITTHEVVLAAFIAAFAIPEVAKGLHDRWKRRRAGDWPETRATVQSGKVQQVRGRRLDSDTAELGYSYSAGDEYYSGFYERRFKDEDSAHAMDARED
jgi:hypothetical protein